MLQRECIVSKTQEKLLQAQEGEDNGKGQTSRQEGWSRALEPEKSLDD